MYGRDATTIHDYTPGSNLIASIDSSLLEHQQVLVLLKESLQQAQNRVTKQANKKRIDKQLEVGDLVYLCLCNYIQHSVTARDNQKLSKHFFGPYKILERIGPVAYRLQLPPSSRVHPVFHVSLLKASHEQTVSGEFPNEWLSDTTIQTPNPESILQHRQMNGCTQLLVKWASQSISEATWEDENELTLRFLEFNTRLEDDSNFNGEGIDTAQQL